MSNEQIARGSVLSIIAELDRRDAEIERLRNDDLATQCSEQSLEIERLRGLLEDACRWHTQFPVQHEACGE